MTTAVTVQVPEGASYVARVVVTGQNAEGETVSRHSETVQPGATRLFYASSSASVLVREAPIAANETARREPEPA